MARATLAQALTSLPRCEELWQPNPEIKHATDLVAEQYLLPNQADLSQPCLGNSPSQYVATQNMLTQGQSSAFRPLAFLANVLTLGLSGCSEGSLDINGKEVKNLSPLNDESAISPPIYGKVRGLRFDQIGDGPILGAYSVSDLDDPEEHGTFSFHVDGLDYYFLPEKIQSPESIARETEVVALDNNTSVVLLRRVTDPEQPGQLVFQMFTETGEKLGAEVEVTQTQGVGAKLVPLQEGFAVLYLGNEDGQLKMKAYDFTGELSLAERDVDLTLPPDAMAIARAEEGRWVLAARQGQNIEVRSFVDQEPGAIDVRVGSGAISSDAQISVGMAPDGSVMVVWNALKEANIPFLQGLFLDPSGENFNDDFDLEELTRELDQEGNVFINSHAVTTDEYGNFILIVEQGGNFQALSYQGIHDSEKPQRFPFLSPNPSPILTQEPFMAFLKGVHLDAVGSHRDDVSAIVSDGNLFLGYSQFFSVENPQEETQNVAAVAYQTFELVY